MYVPEIIEVKELLESLKTSGLIDSWELPYENLLTRRSAAIFYLTPKGEAGSDADKIWAHLTKYDHFSYRLNTEKKLSKLQFRITFSKEESEKNNRLADGLLR